MSRHNLLLANLAVSYLVLLIAAVGPCSCWEGKFNDSNELGVLIFKISLCFFFCFLFTQTQSSLSELKKSFASFKPTPSTDVSLSKLRFIVLY